MNFFMRAAGGDAPAVTPETLWGKAGDNSLIGWFNPSNPFFNWIGTTPSSEAPTAYCQNDNDILTYGLLYGSECLTYGTTIVRSAILKSDGERNSFIDFGAANNSKFYEFTNSKKILKIFHAVNPHASIMGWIRKQVNGTAQILMNSNNSTTAARGIDFQLTSTNTLFLQITFGTGGQSVVNKTFTTTITVADGWVPFCLSMDGGGVAKGTLFVKKNGITTSETFDIHATNGSSAEATNELRIATRLTAGNYYTGLLGDYAFLNRSCTIDDFEDWCSFNLPREISTTAITFVELDANERVFSDTLITPAINGQAIQAWGSKTPYIGGDPERYLFQATAAQKPIYVAADADANNNAAIELYGLDQPFPGNNSNLVSQNQCLGSEKVPIYTEIKVFRNKKANPGSHLLSSTSSGYPVVVGDNYVSNPLPGDPEYAVDHITLTETTPYAILNRLHQAYNVVAMRVNVPAGTKTSWNGAKQKTPEAMGALALSQMVNMGQTWKDPITEGNWWMWGNWCYRLLIYGELTDAQVEQKIDEAIARYGLN